ncbi:MAG: hypothetical protein HOP11_03585 [Saprospiraceae bacterium]|nr:hypothetical protein [Saprospiraceae bacterium]
MIPATRSYNSLVPRPDWVIDVHHKYGNTQDIINSLIKAYQYNNYQAKREMTDLAAGIKGNTDYDTLYNTWLYVFNKINYKRDNNGKEIIKNPAVLYYVGYGDCKSFSLMIGSILSHFKTIKWSFRFVAQKTGGNYDHVYVVAKIDGYQKNIILDATLSQFDFEVPGITKAKDYSMTEIIHMHGPRFAYLTNAKPSIGEINRNSPKNAVSPRIDVTKWTQGQLKLQLLKNRYAIRQAYYGDVNNVFSKAIFMIDNAIKGGLQNFNVSSGVIDPIYNDLIRNIYSAKEKHISQIQIIESASNAVGISGKDRWSGLLTFPDLKKCIDTFKPEKADSFYRSFHDFVTYYDEKSGQTSSYKVSSPEFRACIDQAKLAKWARNNIFEKEDFKRGALSMMYEFVDQENEARLNSIGQTKMLFHKSSIDGFSSVSGMDRENVALYTSNGIEYNAALNKFPELSPKFHFDALSDGVKYKGQPGINEPFITAAVIVAIGTAIAKIISAVKSAGPTYESNLSAFTKGNLGESSKASINDFKEDILTLSNLGTFVPIALGGAALVYFLLKKSKN